MGVITLPSQHNSSLSLRSDGRECGALALQWYFRTKGDRWVHCCEIAVTVALSGLRRSNLSQEEIDEWAAGFRQALGNLPGADEILEAT